MTIGRIPSVEGGIQPTIVDAKGDLIAGVAADSVNRLAVGSNDQVLVADSTQGTGLAWKSYGAQFVAGKNKIINGDFGIWQRGTSFTGTSQYAADRFYTESDGNGTFAFSRQTFTPGSAPVTGYEGQYFMRLGCTTVGTTTRMDLNQRIEDVRTLAGQTVTLSFWAKADTTRTLNAWAIQVFGGGGSSDTYTPLNSQPFTITTSWQRFSYTFAMPSISGKTIGTNSFLLLLFRYTPASGSSMDIWGMQLEAGSTATPFTTATGTIQGELAACQRYYWRAGLDSSGLYGILGNSGYTDSTTNSNVMFNFPVHMRVAPTAIDYPTLSTTRVLNLGNPFVPTAASLNTTNTTADIGWVAFTSSSMTSGQFSQYTRNNSSTAYIGFSAEL